MFVIPLLTACCLAAVTSIIKLMKDKEDLTSKMVRCGKSLNEVTNISLAINDENYVFFYDVNKLTIHDMAIEFCANNGEELGYTIGSFNSCVRPLVNTFETRLADGNSTNMRDLEPIVLRYDAKQQYSNGVGIDKLATDQIYQAIPHMSSAFRRQHRHASRGAFNPHAGMDMTGSSNPHTAAATAAATASADKEEKGDVVSTEKEVESSSALLAEENRKPLSSDNTDYTGGESAAPESNIAGMDAQQQPASTVKNGTLQVDLQIGGTTYLFEYMYGLDVGSSADTLSRHFCKRFGLELLKGYFQTAGVTTELARTAAIQEHCANPVAQALTTAIYEKLPAHLQTPLPTE